MSWSILKRLDSVRVLNISVQVIAEFKGFFTECLIFDIEQFLCHHSERSAEQQVRDRRVWNWKVTRKPILVFVQTQTVGCALSSRFSSDVLMYSNSHVTRNRWSVRKFQLFLWVGEEGKSYFGSPNVRNTLLILPTLYYRELRLQLYEVFLVLSRSRNVTVNNINSSLSQHAKIKVL